MDRRVVIGAGMVVFLLGMVLQAAGPTYGVVMTGRIVAAFGAAAFQANAFAVAGVLAPPDRRSRAFAMIAVGAGLAAVLGVPFGLLIGRLWGWRGTLWTVAALAAVSAVLAGLFVPSMRVPAATMRDRLAVLLDRRILALLTVSALMLAPLYLLGSFASAVVGVSSPGDARAILIALSGYGVGFFAGNRLAGLFADRFASLAVIVTVLGVVALDSGVLAVVEHWFPPTLAALLILGMTGPSLIVSQQNRVFVAGGDAAVIALSLSGSMNYLGAAIGSGIGGVVLADAGPLWLAPAAAVLALAVIVVAMTTAAFSGARYTVE
jgi:predicted MFS family arabinose efflux permease